ncbi:MAG: transposase [Chloroflexota bacterium]|nr:transposase [Chloroflexota bacterium]
MVSEQREEALEQWINQAIEGRIPPFRTVMMGVYRDEVVG